ncbi:response regulator [Chitinophaga horti]|uniref:histidine kinase n=1 Tax=Chitinophaga horti TaxID=2920382 RepID=A0ABY6JC05_9BACT|nr:hybrid sensor histidine kinase/response regulator transcription factor [Chitinophaga horti]UYQ95834.1 response regulator [Chitinophaga horti]
MRKIVLTATLFFVYVMLSVAGELPVRYLGIQQGLSNNAITTIYQDAHGFMWIGTYDGLNRYDGYNFRIYRNVIGDSTSLSTNNVYCLEGDSMRRTWVGTQNGLNVFDPRTGHFSMPVFQSLKVKQQPLFGEISALKTINDNLLLAGSQRSGLVVFGKDGKGRQIALPGGEGSYHVHAIEYDRQRNKIWVFVQNYGLYTYDAATHRLTLASNNIRRANCMKADPAGNLWIGTEADLALYDPARNVVTHDFMPVKSPVIGLCFDRKNVLWIGCDGAGAYKLAPGAKQAIAFRGEGATGPINSNAVYAVYADRDDRMWIGTLRGGLNIIEPRPIPFEWVRYEGKTGRIVENFILSFCQDGNSLYIGTDGAGLRNWNMDDNTYTEYRYDPKNTSALSSNFITNLVKDDQGDIWISTWFGGISRLKHHNKQFERYTLFNPNTGREENNTWTVYQDHRKTIWAGATNEGCLYRYNPVQNKFELFDAAIMNLQSIAEDSKGVLWGGNYNALIRIDRGKKQHQFYSINQPVRAIHETRKGEFWLGTQGAGLLLFDRSTGKYKQYTTADGLPSNTVLRMLEDRQGNLWLSTYNGLARFNPVTKMVDHYSQEDGLQSNQFSFNAACALSSGRFVFGGINGFNIFNPDSVFSEETHPPLFLNHIKVGDRPIEAYPEYITERNRESVKHITLPFNQAVLSLDFVALDYSGADKIRYACLLEGWDKGWNYLEESRTASYARLQEGNYLFKVKVSQPGKGWSADTVLLRVTVLPPWYRSWWAYTIYLALIFGSIYAYVKYTRRQERLKYEIRLAHLENQKEKEHAERKLSFFTNISHEFRTPLSLIINPLRSRLDKAPDLDLTVAYRNARRLLSLVDQLLLFRQADSGADGLKVSRFNIIGLCDEVYQCFIQQAAARKIDYQFRSPGREVPVQADYEKIEIALFNLLSNAFKFTPDGGAISLVLEEEGSEHISIRVSDTGCGIAEADQSSVFAKFSRTGSASTQKTGFGIGLYLVKHFVESHQGRVLLRSLPGKGADFTIVLPRLAGEVIAEVHAPQSGTLLQELAEDAPAPVTAPDLPEDGRVASEIVTDRKSVLVIDDDREIREYLQRLFSDKYHVMTAADGLEGFQTASSQLPDLIVSDVNMEGLDGVQLCRQVKASPVLGHIPVILLTAASSSDSRLEGVEGGADDYMTKPFDSQLLLARVETILKNRNLVQQFFFDSITLQQSTVKVPAAYQEFLQQAIQVVEANLETEDFTIQKFCKEMGMSRSSVYAKIKHVSAQSPNAFIRSIRIRRAAVLMLRENMNVNQAAFQVGIADARYFREQFVKLFGITPSAYIKKYRQSFNLDLNLLRPEGEK